MKIISIETGMADFNILCDDSESMNFIIDYGYESSYSQIGLYYKFVNQDNSSGLITHFHYDHYNGFELLLKNKKNVIWNNFYLPKLFPYKTLFLNPLAKLILVSFFSKHSYYNYNTMVRIFDLVEGIFSHSKNVVSVCEGSVINELGECFYVLWPPCPNADYLPEFEKELRSHKLFAYTVKVIDMYKKNEIDIEEIESILESFSSAINKNSIELLRKTRKEYIELYERLSGKSYTVILEDKYEFKRLIQELSSDINTHSIVFHIRDKVLMTGDITPKILDDKISPKLSRKYELIKAPHHGTSSCYPKKFPNASNIIINNSHGKSKISMIDTRYNYYQGVLFDSIYCSDGDGTLRSKVRCDNAAINPCRASNCSFSSHYKIVKF